MKNNRLQRETGRGMVALRLFRLVDLLQVSRLSCTDLAHRFEVSPRTIQRDLDWLRELGFDVHLTHDEDDKRRAYVRIVGRFSEVA